MLYGIVGGKGSGKTLLLTIMLKSYKDKDKNLDIYSNYNLSDIEFKKIDFNKLFNNEKIKNAVVGIDELYLFADCRRSTTKLNRLISYMMYQTRKASLDIFYSVVKFSTIDIRLRRGTDALICPHIYIDNKKVTQTEKLTKEKMNSLIDNGCKIELKGIIYTDGGATKFKIDNPQNYFKYYNSYEIIRPEEIK